MRKITEEKRSVGRVEFFEDLKQRFFLARPHGVINPSLLKKDVELARTFANKCNAPWTYVTNTEDVRLVNPFNLLYLKEVKKIKHLKRIVIFAPGMINRVLIALASKLIQPDLIVTDKKKFQKLLMDIK